jgi:hypothetical protein
MYKDEFSCRKDVEDNFQVTLSNENILFAGYGYECYEGNAYVLFEQDGKLYEVEGGHCSCYGLEGQWDPVEATKETIQQRITADNYNMRPWMDDIKQIVEKL